MRDDTTIRAKRIAERLHDVDPVTAAVDAQSILDTFNHQDRLDLLPAHAPSWQHMQDLVYHEVGHCMVALKSGATAISVRIRDDGSGLCLHGPIEKLEDQILCTLAGVCAQARFNPSSIHSNTGGYDYLNARRLIDELNARGEWPPPLSYERAASRAIQFVEDHWHGIENLALIVSYCGEISDHDIRLFAPLRRRT
jgi:hypothetical protein